MWGETPPCCNGSLPSWYGGSVGSTPTGGSGTNDERGDTVRESVQRPGLNPGVCGFDSHPCQCRGCGDAFGRAVVRQAGCNPAAPRGATWVRFPPGALAVEFRVPSSEFQVPCWVRNSKLGSWNGYPARSSSGKDAWLSTTRPGFNSPTSRCEVWPVRPTDRTPGSQPESGGSIPPRVTRSLFVIRPSSFGRLKRCLGARMTNDE